MNNKYLGSCLCEQVKFEIVGSFDSGSALPHYQMDGKLLVVPAGSLDSEIGVKPDAHLFCSSRACWEEGLENIKKFEKLPT